MKASEKGRSCSQVARLVNRVPRSPGHFGLSACYDRIHIRQAWSTVPKDGYSMGTIPILAQFSILLCRRGALWCRWLLLVGCWQASTPSSLSWLKLDFRLKQLKLILSFLTRTTELGHWIGTNLQQSMACVSAWTHFSDSVGLKENQNKTMACAKTKMGQAQLKEEHPAGIRSTTGSLSASPRTTPYQLSRGDTYHRQSVSAGKTNAIPSEPSGRLKGRLHPSWSTSTPPTPKKGTAACGSYKASVNRNHCRGFWWNHPGCAYPWNEIGREQQLWISSACCVTSAR